MTDHLTHAEVQRYRELAEKATEGPWGCWDSWDGGDVVAMPRLGPVVGGGILVQRTGGSERDFYMKKSDALFITAAREAVPRLCDTVDALRTENEMLRTALSKAAILALEDLKQELLK